MNKKIALIACAALGLTITTVALTTVSKRTQLIDYQGISSHEDVIVYQGRTYIPLRTFTNLMDVSVIYSEGTIYLSDLPQQPIQPTTAEFLSKDSVKTLALKHAQMKESDIILKPIRLNKEHNRMVYDVKFIKNKIEYDYEIDAYTGDIVSYSSDTD